MAKNMKYSKPFAVLLFLFLLHESLSSVAPPSPKPRVFRTTKPYFNALYNRVEKALDLIKHQLHGSPQPAKIKGLSVLKQYFYDMGYMNYSSSLFTDEWGNETTSAISAYQNFFNLKVNGRLDNETLTHMHDVLTRCSEMPSSGGRRP